MKTCYDVMRPSHISNNDSSLVGRGHSPVFMSLCNPSRIKVLILINQAVCIIFLESCQVPLMQQLAKLCVSGLAAIAN